MPLLVDKILSDVQSEFGRAAVSNPPHNSYHEGWAVLLEEMDELWDEIKKNPSNRDSDLIRAEAIQVAAMAVRLIHDCC